MPITRNSYKTNFRILLLFFEVCYRVEKCIHKWHTNDHMAKNAYGNLKDLCKHLIKVLVNSIAEFLLLLKAIYGAVGHLPQFHPYLLQSGLHFV